MIPNPYGFSNTPTRLERLIELGRREMAAQDKKHKETCKKNKAKRKKK